MYPIKDGNAMAYAIEIHAVRAVQRKYLYRLTERSARNEGFVSGSGELL